MKNIYVLCPSYLISGGPDALHQIVYYLNKINQYAYLVYVDLRKKKYKVPACYQEYIKNGEYKLLSEIEDKSDNAIICPETLTFLLDKYSNVKKYVWWLSVNNDTERSNIFDKFKILLRKLSPKQLIKQIKKKNKLLNVIYFFKHKKFDFTDNGNITHLCASYYAYDYVSNNTNAECFLCVEPISKYFLDNINYGTECHREDTVIYNPAKNFKFTKKIIKACKGINFLPLKGYSQVELLNIYRKSKLYIDFGTFPGAERIPKEAVINGCCILTGRNGASAYFNDVPINDEFKIASVNENLSLIKSKIEWILSDYDNCIDYFEVYRQFVKNLETNFIEQLSKIFGSNNMGIS